MKKYTYSILYLLFSAVLLQPATVQAQEPDSTALWTVQREASYSRLSGGGSIFDNSPEIDVAKALYGRLSGLHVNQGSGSSANNQSTLSLHGRSPLVLIDGYRRDLGDITASEIESVTIMKDAAAAALYGVKGGNGVVLITTKRGTISPLKVTAEYHYGVHTPFRNPDFADSYTYAGKLNEALELDGLPAEYPSMELEAFRTGRWPYAYPNVDWMAESFKKAASNHRLTLTFRGGSKRFRYFSAIDYMYDDALYRNQSTDDRYNVNHYDTRLGVRGNIDVDITNTTFMKVGVMARISQFNRTNATGIESVIYSTPSAAFPVRQQDGTYGGSAVYGANNPVALLNDKGAFTQSKATVLADLTLRQDISPWVPGLSVDASVAFDYIGAMNDTSTKQYRYSELDADILDDGTLVTEQFWYGLDSQTLSHGQSFQSLVMRSEFNARVNYDRDFGRHHLDAHAVYRQRAYITNGRNNSSKTQEALLTANYNFADRYIVDLVANWSGTAYLPEGDRFNFYPAANFAWVASNETFMKGAAWLSYLKVFASAGISGFDGNMTHELYLQTYGTANAGDYLFTHNASSAGGGQAEGNLAAQFLAPEKLSKVTLGIDFRLFDDRLALYGEGFMERRSNILVAPQNISGVIGIGLRNQSLGIQDYAGVDFSVAWNDKAGDFRYGVYANGSWLRSEIVEDGQAYQRYDYLYHKGNRVNQMYGLEAIGFFRDWAQIESAPEQLFGDVRPGDIMYKDQNGDKKIDSEDVVPLFNSSVPHCTFGFGINLGWRNWELSSDFSGRTNVTVNLLNSPLYQPLVSNSTISDTFLEREITWTPETADVATMPRLTTLANANNYRNSSLWYRDGSFIKLRNLKLSYTFPKRMVKFSDMTVYLQGTNLFSIDDIKFADPEQLVAAYPSTRAFWVGLKFKF